MFFRISTIEEPRGHLQVALYSRKTLITPSSLRKAGLAQSASRQNDRTFQSDDYVGDKREDSV